jgi:Flp pilus assembly protein TadG
MVEAAIMTPLLLLVTFSIVDFAAMFYVHLTLESAVSQATRYAVTGRTLEDPSAPGSPLDRAATIRLAMRRAAPTLTVADSAFEFSHMTPGGASWVAGVGGPGDIERVTVRYTWTFFTPTVRYFFPDGRLNLRAESMMKNESRFQ